jgi:hexosaminidase
MPEFDIPGHGDWEGGEPSVVVTDGPCKDTLDPTKNETYDFLAAFLAEVTTVFPDEFLFLGGDEVQANCWSGSKSVQVCDFVLCMGVRMLANLLYANFFCVAL